MTIGKSKTKQRQQTYRLTGIDFPFFFIGERSQVFNISLSHLHLIRPRAFTTPLFEEPCKIPEFTQLLTFSDPS